VGEGRGRGGGACSQRPDSYRFAWPPAAPSETLRGIHMDGLNEPDGTVFTTKIMYFDNKRILDYWN